MDGTLKIVLTGPESSGKSDLCTALGQHYGVPVQQEFARTYLEKHGPVYTFEDFEKMFEGHCHQQQQAIKNAGDLLLLDTDTINYYVWAKRVFGMIPDRIEAQLPEENDHRYLITYPDIPWKTDPLRVDPNNRQEIYHEHLNLIRSLKRPYKVIEGQGKTRVENAIAAVEELKNL